MLAGGGHRSATRFATRLTCYRIEKRETQKMAGEGAGKSAGEIRGAGGSAGKGAAPYSFPRKPPKEQHPCRNQ